MAFNGDHPVILPSIGVFANPGDVVDVPDDFANANFSPVVPTQPTASPKTKPEGESK